MYEPKVGETVKHACCTDSRKVAMVTTNHVVVLDGLGVPAIWHKSGVIPPPPTVVQEGWINNYEASYWGVKNCTVFSSREQAESVIVKQTPGKRWLNFIHIQEFSDGTWKIEKVA